MPRFLRAHYLAVIIVIGVIVGNNSRSHKPASVRSRRSHQVPHRPPGPQEQRARRLVFELKDGSGDAYRCQTEVIAQAKGEKQFTGPASGKRFEVGLPGQA